MVAKFLNNNSKETKNDNNSLTNDSPQGYNSGRLGDLMPEEISDNYYHDETSSESVKIPHNHILDMNLKEIFKEWSKTMLDIINNIIDIGNDSQYINWRERLNKIYQQLNDKKRIFYLGITFIVISILLFYFELSH